MGQVQFMPSSFLNFAVDYDGDGRKDLWHTRADVFASAANYLQQHGWHHNGGWSSRVRVPSAFDESLIGVEVKKPVADWYRLGVRSLDGSALPSRAGEASVVMPDDKHGRAYLAYNNYMVLRSWNRSNYFVISVGYLADRIVGG
jgi:membrane-bound lytic murein transglycosylase B